MAGNIAIGIMIPAKRVKKEAKPDKKYFTLGVSKLNGPDVLK